MDDENNLKKQNEVLGYDSQPNQPASIYPEATSPAMRDVHSEQTIDSNSSPAYEIKQDKPLVTIGGLWIALIVIFLVGMILAPTEEAVDMVSWVFLIVGFITVVGTGGSIVHKSRRRLSNIHQEAPSIAHNHSLWLGLLLLVLIPPIGVLILILVSVDYIVKRVRSKPGRELGKISKFFIIAVSTIIGVASAAALILAGLFFLSLRACELSSSKCI